MRRSVVFILFLICFGLEVVAPQNSFAKWDSVLTCRVGGNGQVRAAWCGFFFNEFVGFVGSAGDAGIYKTTDGGKSWVRTTIPNGYNGNVTQIFMTTQLRGWATIEEPGAAVQCLLKTVNGGLNWTAVGPNGYFSCVYETPSALVVASRLIGGSGLISTNGGATFQNNVIQGSNGIDFVDDLNGVITTFKNTRWKKTADGGVTWTDIIPFQTTESWSVYGVKGTSTFFASPEQDPVLRPRPGTSKVMISNDFGSNWSQQANLSFYSTGTINGAVGAIYVQADSEKALNGNITGLFRSSDNGISWKSVGGPSTSQDSRFVVTGCSGGVVYAFDGKGTVWKTRDGGDGSLQEPPIELMITGNPIILNGRICSTSLVSLKFLNLYCEDDTLLSVDLVDSLSNLFTSGALTLVKIPGLPSALKTNKEDSIVLSWEPFKLFHHDTVVNTKIRLRYYSRILQRIVDTTVNFSAHAVGDSPDVLVTPPTINFGSRVFCTPYDTIITVVNRGCDTLSILNTIAGPPANFTIFDVNGAPLVLPITLVPLDSIRIRVRVNISSAGVYSNTLTLKLSHQGIAGDTIVPLSATVSSVGSYLITDSIILAPISICNSIDTIAILKNLGCGDITIISATLKNATAFSVKTIASPVIAGATGTISLHFGSGTVGTYTDVLTVTFTTLGETKTITIPLRGSVFASPAFLKSSLGLGTLFDLKLTRCNTAQSVTFILSNPSCDSLNKITISKIAIQPPNDPDITFSNITTPFVLSDVNQQTLAILVTINPKVVGIHNGTLTLTYNIGNGVSRDTTIAYFLDVSYGSRILSVDKDSIYFGRFPFCETRDTTIILKNLGCDSLDILNFSIQGQGKFTLTSTPNLQLKNNDQTAVSFHFEPTSAGRVYGNIIIRSNSDNNDTLRIIPIVADIIPTDTLSFSIEASRVDFKAGDTVSFFLVPNRNVKSKGIRDISFTLNYNGDLLTILGNKIQVLIPNATYIAAPTNGTPKHTTTRIFLTGLPTIEMDSLVPIMRLIFSTALTDSVSSTMSISQVSINGGDPNFAKCELGIVSADITYTLLLVCGDSTLIKYLQLGKNFTLKAIDVTPDPVTSANNYRAHIGFTANVVGSFTVNVFDPLGKLVLTKEMTTNHTGSFDLELDASRLSSGAYHYTLKHQETNQAVDGGFRVVR